MSERTVESSNFESADLGGARRFDVTHRMVWAITIPMTLAFLTTPLIGLTDTAVVGQVGDAAALGGLTVGALVFDFAFATCNFIRTGTTGLAAQAYGAGQGREVHVRKFITRGTVEERMLGHPPPIRLAACSITHDESHIMSGIVS